MGLLVSLTWIDVNFVGVKDISPAILQHVIAHMIHGRGALIGKPYMQTWATECARLKLGL